MLRYAPANWPTHLEAARPMKLTARAIAAVVCICIAVLFHFQSASAGSPKDHLAGFDKYAEKALADWKVPGMAVAIVKDGKVVLARGYGVRTLGEKGRVDERTIFGIASCTKSFTAACIALLVEEGKLSWDDPVTKHLPGFKVADPYAAKEITLRDLLCHRSGLEDYMLLWLRRDFSREDILRRMQFLPQRHAFRSRYSYNTLGYIVIGEAVSKVSGKNWETFVRERIFQPWGMNSTSALCPELGAKGNVASAHKEWDGTVTPHPDWHWKDKVAPAGPIGSMHSNVVDLADWVRLHLAGGALNGKRLLKESTLREMHALHASLPLTSEEKGVLPYPKMFFGSGLGWLIRDYQGCKVVYHNGGSGAMIALMPEKNLGVVVLANLYDTGLVSMVMHAVFDRFLGFPRTWSSRDWIAEAYEGPLREAQAARKKREAERIKGTKPSLPIEKYAGIYESPLYGTIEVHVKDGKLTLHFGPRLVSELTQWQNDMFEAVFPNAWKMTTLFAFRSNGTSLAAPFFLGAGFQSAGAMRASVDVTNGT
jgi:CubicO group peptidase (beta-lactamase class C family)